MNFIIAIEEDATGIVGSGIAKTIEKIQNHHGAMIVSNGTFISQNLSHSEHKTEISP